MVGLTVLGERLDSMFLEVFSDTDDSMIPSRQQLPPEIAIVWMTPECTYGHVSSTAFHSQNSRLLNQLKPLRGCLDVNIDLHI